MTRLLRRRSRPAGGRLGGRPRVPVVLVGLDSLQGLQVARLFWERGVSVFGVAKNREYYSCKTRACEEIVYTDTAGDELLDTLEAIAARLGQKAVLIACQDKNVLVISRNRDRLETWYHLMLPDQDIVETMIDKSLFHEYARENGIPVPPTAVLRTRDDALQAARSLPFPAVVKPHYRSSEWSRHTKTKAMRVEGPEELISAYDHHAQWVEVLIAQQWIDGEDSDLYTCNVTFDHESKPVASFVSRKIRQWPPQLGQGCSAVDFPDEEIEKITIRLYERAGLKGFGYLEMKRDAATGSLYAVEPNIGRPTGRSALAEAAGVELHYSLYCDALGLPLPENRRQNGSGVKWIHELRDVQSALHDVRQRRLTVRQWLASLRGPKVYAIFSWKDPVPFLNAMSVALPVFLSPRERGKNDYRFRE